MARKTLTITNFSGGLDTMADKTIMPNNRAPHLLNVDIANGGGAIKTRKGFQSYYNVSSKPVRLVGFYDANNFQSIITSDSDGFIKSSKVTSYEVPTTIRGSEINPDQQRVATFWNRALVPTAYDTTTTVNVPRGKSRVTGWGLPFSLQTDKGTYSASYGVRDDSEPYYFEIDSTNGTAELSLPALLNTESLRLEAVINQGERFTGGTAYRNLHIPETTSFVRFVLSFEHGNNYRANNVCTFSFGGFRYDLQKAKNTNYIRVQIKAGGELVFNYIPTIQLEEYAIDFKLERINGILYITPLRFGARELNISSRANSSTTSVYMALGAWSSASDVRTAGESGMYARTHLRHFFIGHKAQAPMQVSDFTQTTDAGAASPSLLRVAHSFPRHQAYAFIQHFTTIPSNEINTEIGTQDADQIGQRGLRAVGLQHDDKFIFSNRSYGKVMSFDGASTQQLTPQGSSLGAQAMIVKQDRLFIGGKNTDATLVEYSSVGDFSDWAGGGAIRVSTKGSGEYITAFGSYRDWIIVGTNRALYGVLVKGVESDWWVRQLSTHQGCVAPLSMVSAPNSVMWLGENGIYSYGAVDGFGGDGEGVMTLSNNIESLVKSIQNKEIAAGAYYQNKYYLSVALDSSVRNTHTLVGSSGADGIAWTLYDYGFSSFERHGEDLFAGGYTGKIYRVEVGADDDGEVIKMEYDTPLFANSPKIKDFREITLSARSNNTQDLTVIFNTDATEDTPPLTMFSQAENQVQRLPFRRKGYAVGLKIRAAETDPSLTISQITIPFNERARH